MGEAFRGLPAFRTQMSMCEISGLQCTDLCDVGRQSPSRLLNLMNSLRFHCTVFCDSGTSPSRCVWGQVLLPVQVVSSAGGGKQLTADHASKGKQSIPSI